MAKMRERKKDSLEDYVPVHERVKLFRKEWPEGVIVTERTDVSEDVVAFKAKVYRTLGEVEVLAPVGLAASTGHSEVEVSDEKAVEKGETVAIGRALANLGYEIEKGIASAEEMEDVEEEEESPRQRRNRSKDDEEESPRRRRSRKRDEDESEEEEEKPRTRRSRKKDEEDEEEESPRRTRRSRRAEKEEEPEESEDSEDEEEEKPRRGRRKSSSLRFG